MFLQFKEGGRERIINTNHISRMCYSTAYGKSLNISFVDGGDALMLDGDDAERVWESLSDLTDAQAYDNRPGWVVLTDAPEARRKLTVD